jgi:hypothetical protein
VRQGHGADLRRNLLVLVVPRSTRANPSLPTPLQGFVPPTFPRPSSGAKLIRRLPLWLTVGMDLSLLTPVADLEEDAKRPPGGGSRNSHIAVSGPA